MKGSPLNIVTVTGGSDGMSQKYTFYIDFNSYTLSPGPSLIEARSRHGCTAFENNERTIVLVAGGWNPNLATVEYLDLSQNNPTWNSGPQLPSKMDDLVLTNTNIGVLMIGGFDSTIIDYSNLIHQLVCNTIDIRDCIWQEFQQTLAMKQSSPVVIPIPTSLNLCQNAISTTTLQPMASPSESTTVTLTPVSGAVSSQQEDCSYCPECARPEYNDYDYYEMMGGSSSFAEIEKVHNFELQYKCAFHFYSFSGPGLLALAGSMVHIGKHIVLVPSYQDIQF